MVDGHSNDRIKKRRKILHLSHYQSPLLNILKQYFLLPNSSYSSLEKPNICTDKYNLRHNLLICYFIRMTLIKKCNNRLLSMWFQILYYKYVVNKYKYFDQLHLTVMIQCFSFILGQTAKKCLLQLQLLLRPVHFSNINMQLFLQSPTLN